MITNKSSKREIRDLQRMLISLGHLEWTIDATGGKWGAETQAAVEAGYAALGWEHPDGEKWVSAPALAAMAARLPQVSAAGGGGSYAGGGGSYAGGGGSYAGGGGSYAGGGGSYAGGGGSYAGGGGSYAGGGGSYAGGGGSYAGGGSAPDEAPDAEDDAESDD